MRSPRTGPMDCSSQTYPPYGGFCRTCRSRQSSARTGPREFRGRRQLSSLARELAFRRRGVQLVLGFDVVAIAIDKPAAKRAILENLADHEVLFVDSGMGLTLTDEHSVRGQVRVTTKRPVAARPRCAWCLASRVRRRRLPDQHSDCRAQLNRGKPRGAAMDEALRVLRGRDRGSQHDLRRRDRTGRHRGPHEINRRSDLPRVEWSPT